MKRKQIIFQIRIRCSDDYNGDFWYDKELSSYYVNPLDAKQELKKYEGKSQMELQVMCQTNYLNGNKPRIVELMLILD